MRSGQTKNQWILVAAISLVAALVSGIGGLIVASSYGANYGRDLEFNGVRGYEAYGQIGLAVGAVVGGGAVCWLTTKIVSLRNSRRSSGP